MKELIKFFGKLFGNKINFLTWILILTMLQDYLMETDFSNMTGKEISVSVIGFLIIIVRSFFHTPDKKIQRMKDRGVDVETLSKKK